MVAIVEQDITVNSVLTEIYLLLQNSTKIDAPNSYYNLSTAEKQAVLDSLDIAMYEINESGNGYVTIAY